MSQIVVDTDVASYIFSWHSLAATVRRRLARVRTDSVLQTG
jgi:hypothetical protein